MYPARISRYSHMILAAFGMFRMLSEIPKQLTLFCELERIIEILHVF